MLLDTTYVVTSSISVAQGSSLVIEPGAEFLFNSGSLYIDGHLLAAGTESDTIRFMRNPGHSWQGIEFRDSAADSCLLEYCHISGSVGGGVSVDRCSPTISHCTIADNWNIMSGGGIWCISDANPWITDCLISNNSCYDWGGGIACRFGSNPIIENCVITRNHGRNPQYPGFGAGIWCQLNSSPMIHNCLIYRNWADHEGAGITCEGGAATIVNCTIAGNMTRLHGSYACGLFAAGDSSVTVTNCIIWGNTPRQVFVFGDANISYCDIFHGWLGVGNLDADPLFVSGPEGDFYLSQIAAGQTQQSPCVDTGDPAMPMILGTTRTDGVQDSGIVDIGYHYPLTNGADPIASAKEKQDFSLYPSAFSLSCRPNPFNPSTTISFELPVASFVKLGVYDLAGRRVADLVNGWSEAGTQQITFDGSSLPSGIYIARLTVASLSAAEKLVLMK